MLHIEVDEGVYFNLFSALWRRRSQRQLDPRSGTEIPTVENGGISADGLDLAHQVRDDVKWHDGTPFTAEDVKFTIELINNPDFRAGRRAGPRTGRGHQGRHARPSSTWRMEKPYAPYPAILSWTFIVPKHILEKEADPNTSSFNNDAGRHRSVQVGRAGSRRPHHARGQSPTITAKARISSG